MLANYLELSAPKACFFMTKLCAVNLTYEGYMTILRP
jgi:hypothetical protein